MKRLLIIAVILFSTTVFSQKYEIGASEAMGFAYKLKGSLEITKNMMFMELDSKHNHKSLNFDIINERNGITYVSDGTETFNTSIIERKGKRKGFKYTHIMNFVHPSGQLVIYYIKPL